MESRFGLPPVPLTSEAGLKVTTGLLTPSSGGEDCAMPKPDFVSHESKRSGFGVAFGVLLELSTRLCLDPDLGVILLARNADTGELSSSLSRPLALSVDSGRARRRRGVAREGFEC